MATKIKVEKRPYIILPPARLSFPRFGTPKKFDEEKADEKPKYSCCLLFPHASLPKLKQLQSEVLETAKLWKLVKTAEPLVYVQGFDNPFKNGDEEESKIGVEGYAGHYYISAKGLSRPGLYNGDLTPFTGTVPEIDERFYAGCWVCAKVQAYGFNEGKNRGVAFGLGSVQFIKHGPKLSGGDTTNKGFEAVEDEGTPVEDDFTA